MKILMKYKLNWGTVGGNSEHGDWHTDEIQMKWGAASANSKHGNGNTNRIQMKYYWNTNNI